MSDLLNEMARLSAAEEFFALLDRCPGHPQAMEMAAACRRALK